VRWFSVASGKELRATPTGRVFTLVPTPDGKKAAVWSVPPNVEIPPITSNYDLLPMDGSAPETVPEKNRKVSCAAFSPDATWALAGSPEGTVRIWDLKTKKPAGDDWPLFQSYVVDLGVTADKKTLVAVDDQGTVKVADVAGRKVTATAKAHDKGVNGLIVAKGGGRFATIGTDGEVKAFDMNAKEVRVWKLPTVVNAAAFSPDGKQIVTANGDGTAYVLDVP
jgi:WD40 repeat protein